MKALLMGLEILIVHVKRYAGDYHQKQEFTIQSIFFARASYCSTDLLFVIRHFVAQ